jgi:hypothetical protein
MELDGFSSRLGESQGRVVLPSGDTLFVLGERKPGRLAALVPGDHVEVVQLADLTGVDLLRAVCSLRAPSSLPSGLQWEASLVIDGTRRAAVRCAAGRFRKVTDLATSVSKLVGVHEVGLRLQLINA